MNYRTKSVAVEAEIYRPGMEDCWVRLSGDGGVQFFDTEGAAKAGLAGPLPGNCKPALRHEPGCWQEIEPGDWIVTAHGKRFQLSPADFAATYEPAPDVHADGWQDSGKRASFAQSEDDRRPNPMTDKILQEIADRAEAATPGPWEWWSSCSHWRLTGADGKDGGVISAYKASDGFPCVSIDAADRAFIAHARTDIPLLLSELQKARERVVVLETALKPFAVKDLGRQTYGDFDRARQALSPAPVGEEGS